ncbi:MAG: hypothetical protein K6B52_05895 [Clostridiales bacterium]|nr:hypothetical protein [Clostridiales bacterium]
MKLLKTTAVIMCAIITAGSISITGSAESAAPDRFEITNPYENVDFASFQAYKTQLHCHTTASDGYDKIQDAIEMYYNLDYDAVAITDHGVNNIGWNKTPQMSPLVRAVKKERSGGAYAKIDPLTDEAYEAYLKGTAELKDGVTRTHSAGMCDIALGNELNLATPFADCHLTHYWCTYGQGYAGVFGDYETPSRESSKQGGVVMLSHVGEYVYTKKDSKNHVAKKIDEYYVNKFARVFLDNPVNGGKYSGSVCGMGINSATDAHTRCDRILYDQILQKTIPNGVVPWGFTFSDSHDMESINNAYTMMLAPDWTGLDNDTRNNMIRKAMENGEFFSVSHYSNGYELDGEREFLEIEEDVDWEDCNSMNDTPMVTNVIVDDSTDTITVEAENANRIVWVSNGNVIKRETAEASENGKATFTIQLSEDGLKNDVSLFIRFYVTGPQGICYSNPMVLHGLDENGNPIPFEAVNVPKTHDISTFLRSLVTVLDWGLFKWSPIVWAFKYFALGYNPIAQLVNSIAFWK